MFITCPKCKELIRKDAEECPFCKYSVTAEDILKAEQEDKEKTDRFVQEKMEEYRRRAKIGNIVWIVWVLFSVCSVTAVFSEQFLRRDITCPKHSFPVSSAK